MKSEKIVNVYNLVHKATLSGVALFTTLELNSNDMSSVLKTGPVQPVTFPIRFPFFGRLSIGPVLNHLSQLNRRTAWAEWFNTPNFFFLTKWATPHDLTLIACAPPFFLLTKWTIFSSPPTLNAHPHLAKWPPYPSTRL